MIQYQQSTGKVWIKGVLQSTVGYAGHGLGLNNPDMEDAVGIGPLPKGLWRITTWVDHPHLGRMVSHLLPIQVPFEYHRSGFFIHGDNKLRNHTASDGCIVMDYNLRRAVMKSGDTQLRVVE